MVFPAWLSLLVAQVSCKHHPLFNTNSSGKDSREVSALRKVSGCCTQDKDLPYFWNRNRGNSHEQKGRQHCPVINLDGSSCAQPSAHSLSHIPGIQGEPTSCRAHTQHGRSRQILQHCWPHTLALLPSLTTRETLLKMSKNFYFIAAVKEQQLTERNL